MPNTKALLFSLLAGSLLAACGAVRTYEGPERPPEQLAIYHPYLPEVFRMGRIDGKTYFTATSNTIQLLPGQHEITYYVTYTHPADQAAIDKARNAASDIAYTEIDQRFVLHSYRLNVEMKAGYNYMLDKISGPYGYIKTAPTLCLRGEPQNAPGSEFATFTRHFGQQVQDIGCAELVSTTFDKSRIRVDNEKKAKK
jgi:hypothetical protein